MQPFPWLDLLIILALIALNGLLALSEMAVVSSNRTRLGALAANGRAGAASAVALASEPGRFLSTVQIGITLVGIVAGAYSGASLGGPVADRLARLGLPASLATEAGFALVIALTTYLSLVVGELLPKQFALRSPERIACVIARPMILLSQIAGPLVWLLDRSTAAIFKLLRIRQDDEQHVTTEEIRMIVAEAQNAGVIEESERQMITSVMRLGERQVRAVMTPRTDIDWLDADATPEEARAAFLRTPHSRLLLAEGSVDEILGAIQARDVLNSIVEGRPLDLRALARPVPSVPDVMTALDAIAVLQKAEIPLALVHDEYGHLEGIVTPADLLAAITGSYRADTAGEPEPVVEREDGSWLVSGSLPADRMADRLGLSLPDNRDYHTVAGFVLAELRHLPETGETFQFGDWHFEVVDLDGRKIDKVIISPRRATETETAPPLGQVDG